MTAPSRPNQPDLPESAVSELHALYRAGSAGEPDFSLDRKILDAARRELRADQALKSAKSVPWWKTWTPAISTAAVMLLGLSLTWNLMDEQERALRDELSGAESPPALAKTGQTRTERAAMADSSIKDQPPLAARGLGAVSAAASVSKSTLPTRPDEKAANTAVISSLAQSPDAAGAPEAAQRRHAIAAPAAPAPATPVVVMEKSKSAGDTDARPSQAGVDGLHEKKLDTGAVAGAEARPGKAEAMSRNADLALDAVPASAADATAKQTAKPAASPAPAKKESAGAVDAATPQAWIDHIRKLRAGGHEIEAAQSLDRFRKRYPNVTLPDDLLKVNSR